MVLIIFFCIKLPQLSTKHLPINGLISSFLTVLFYCLIFNCFCLTAAKKYFSCVCLVNANIYLTTLFSQKQKWKSEGMNTSKLWLFCVILQCSTGRFSISVYFTITLWICNNLHINILIWILLDSNSPLDM